jgi:hypothetical protein
MENFTKGSLSQLKDTCSDAVLSLKAETFDSDRTQKNVIRHPATAKPIHKKNSLADSMHGVPLP